MRRFYLRTPSLLMAVTLTLCSAALCGAVPPAVSEGGSVNASTLTWVNTPIGKAVRAGGVVSLPAVVKHVNPRYPGLDVRSGVQGLVRLEVLVDQAGNVLYSEIIDTPACELGNEAKAAVEQWVFAPTIVGDKAVPVLCPVTIRFSLR